MEELNRQRQNNFLQSKGGRPLFIDGLNGSGKSVALAHAVIYARATGWLVLYVPEAYQFVSKYRIKPSQTRKWIYDLHEGAAVLMENFRRSHHDKLGKIKMKGTLPRIDELQAFNDSQTKNTTLLDLIDFGITCDNPSEVFVALRNELDSVTEYPVLIAVDEINCLMGNTGFMKPVGMRESKIHWADGSEISVIRCLNRPDKTTMVNGTFIGALSTRRSVKAFHKQISKEVFDQCKMTVTSYSYEEYRRRLSRFVETGDLFYPPSTITEQYIYQVCSGRPKHVASYLSTLF